MVERQENTGGDSISMLCAAIARSRTLRASILDAFNGVAVSAHGIVLQGWVARLPAMIRNGSLFRHALEDVTLVLGIAAEFSDDEWDEAAARLRNHAGGHVSN